MLLRLKLVPWDRQNRVIETVAQRVLVLLVLDHRVDAAADDVLHKCVGLLSAIDQQLAVKNGKLLGQVDGNSQRLIGQPGRLDRFVQFAKRIGQEALAFAESLGEPVGLGKIEKVPVFLLLDDLHKPKTGQLDIEIVRFFPVLKPGGFQMKRADARHIPQQGDPQRVLIGTVQDQDPVAEINLGRKRDAFRAPWPWVPRA